MSEQARRAPRADGQRNKTKLLEAATLIVRSGCAELYLEHVARDAGVSIATLYRHFPTREALLLEISQQDAVDFHDRAVELLNDMLPVEALELWLDEMSRYGLSRPGMAGAFRVAANDPLGDKVYRRFLGALDNLLAAGQGIGAIRKDLGAEDILLALCGLWDLKDSPETRAQCSRLSSLLVDGLKSKN